MRHSIYIFYSLIICNLIILIWGIIAAFKETEVSPSIDILAYNSGQTRKSPK